MSTAEGLVPPLGKSKNIAKKSTSKLPQILSNGVRSCSPLARIALNNSMAVLTSDSDKVVLNGQNNKHNMDKSSCSEAVFAALSESRKRHCSSDLSDTEENPAKIARKQIEQLTSEQERLVKVITERSESSSNDKQGSIMISSNGNSQGVTSSVKEKLNNISRNENSISPPISCEPINGCDHTSVAPENNIVLDTVEPNLSEVRFNKEVVCDRNPNHHTSNLPLGDSDTTIDNNTPKSDPEILVTNKLISDSNINSQNLADAHVLELNEKVRNSMKGNLKAALTKLSSEKPNHPENVDEASPSCELFVEDGVQNNITDNDGEKPQGYCDSNKLKNSITSDNLAEKTDESSESELKMPLAQKEGNCEDLKKGNSNDKKKVEENNKIAEDDDVILLDQIGDDAENGEDIDDSILDEPADTKESNKTEPRDSTSTSVEYNSLDREITDTKSDTCTPEPQEPCVQEQKNCDDPPCAELTNDDSCERDPNKCLPTTSEVSMHDVVKGSKAEASTHRGLTETTMSSPIDDKICVEDDNNYANSGGFAIDPCIVEELSDSTIMNAVKDGSINDDVKEGNDDVKEGNDDVNEGNGDVKEGHGDVKEGHGDVKEGNGDVNEDREVQIVASDPLTLADGQVSAPSSVISDDLNKVIPEDSTQVTSEEICNDSGHKTSDDSWHTTLDEVETTMAGKPGVSSECGSRPDSRGSSASGPAATDKAEAEQCADVLMVDDVSGELQTNIRSPVKQATSDVVIVCDDEDEDVEVRSPKSNELVDRNADNVHVVETKEVLTNTTEDERKVENGEEIVLTATVRTEGSSHDDLCDTGDKRKRQEESPSPPPDSHKKPKVDQVLGSLVDGKIKAFVTDMKERMTQHLGNRIESLQATVDRWRHQAEALEQQLKAHKKGRRSARIMPFKNMGIQVTEEKVQAAMGGYTNKTNNTPNPKAMATIAAPPPTIPLQSALTVASSAMTIPPGTMLVPVGSGVAPAVTMVAASSLPPASSNIPPGQLQLVQAAPVNPDLSLPLNRGTVREMLHKARKPASSPSSTIPVTSAVQAPTRPSQSVIDLTEDDEASPPKAARSGATTMILQSTGASTAAHSAPTMSSGLRPGAYLVPVSSAPVGTSVLQLPGSAIHAQGTMVYTGSAPTTPQMLPVSIASPAANRNVPPAKSAKTLPLLQPALPSKPSGHPADRSASQTPTTSSSTNGESITQPRSPRAKKRTAPFRRIAANPSHEPLKSESANHPANLPPLPKVQKTQGYKALPPSPGLKISRVPQGIVLSWNMTVESSHADICNYQLFAYQEGSSPPHPGLWKKVGDVKALPLPMACTLTQFQEGNKYHFAVRAVDVHTRVGPFSRPSSISLDKIP